MGHDPRSNPDPSTLRSRVWYAVDGWDATDGLRMRALFSAPDLNTAVAVAQREGMVGELYRVQSGDILTWQRWADALVPHSGLLMIPTPATGEWLGTLELDRRHQRRPVQIR